MDNNYLTIDDLFTNLYIKVCLIEEQWINDNKFDLTNNEIRIINKIGQMKLLSFGNLANSLQVTPGTLTVAVNRLVKKEYVNKLKNEKDKRSIFLSLSTNGYDIYSQHKIFRHDLIKDTLLKLDNGDSKLLINILKELDEKFTNKKY